MIRILPPDESKSVFKLGKKFGAHPHEVPKLISAAKALGLEVVGVRLVFAKHTLIHFILQITLNEINNFSHITFVKGQFMTETQIGVSFLMSFQQHLCIYH